MPNNIAVAAQPSPRRAWMMFFSLVAASLCTLAVRAGAQSAETVYDRAAKVFAAQHNIDAQFEQKITNPLLGRTATSHGRFVQQRPNLVSITFTDPAGDQIVGDGKSLWVYLPSSTPGQALKLPANSDGAIIVNMLGQLLEAPRQSFTMSGGDAAVVDGAVTHRVQLVPRVANSVPFQKATLWIDDTDGRPRRVQVIDDQGVDRTITLNTWTTNTTVDKKVFTFSPPKGVKIISKVP
jgi:outer membrane lipoprotein carrier protein